MEIDSLRAELERLFQLDELVTLSRELLGFDPLYVACEGRFLAIVPGGRAEAALAAIRSAPGGEGARRIGAVVADDPGRLVLRTRIGSHRLLERLSGEQLPRIC